ncbi:MAG: carbamoyltransferase HypF [Phycisphaerae bacterium]
MTSGATTIERRQVSVQGAVQGVGFRPFVFRLAVDLQLRGWVENTPDGVRIDVLGPKATLGDFEKRLQSDAPPLALITGLVSCPAPYVHYSGFEIRNSRSHGSRRTLILPDIVTCDECAAEIFDPANRRYRYPFTNCTNCGPRYSIITGLPYDRPLTTMRDFVMCEACLHEYEDPLDRRFHAQPNACPKCGPQLSLHDKNGTLRATGHDALRQAASAIRHGLIVAVKGIGGYQLMVSAVLRKAIVTLRRRKQRPDKALAIMVASLEQAALHAHIEEEDAILLRSPAGPVTLIHRKDRSCLASNIAPRSSLLGMMLPTTPLHHLLLRETGEPVVATSGNRTDEPLCIENDEALLRLGNVADLFLMHDRPIMRQVDDSVARLWCGRPVLIRRARGYAPLPIAVSECQTPLVAVGPQQKNTIAVAGNGHVVVSQHIGNLGSVSTNRSFRQTLKELPELQGIEPVVVAHDRHPDYESTRFVADLPLPAVGIQHHFAHIVACLAEHEQNDPVIGFSWDGTGYGDDGTVWGGETLLADKRRYERFATFSAFPLPGGDQASREPRRSALGLLWRTFGAETMSEWQALLPHFRTSDIRVLSRAMTTGTNAPLTSSVGRLFDAVSCLIGGQPAVSYEGQAAIELEQLALQSDNEDTYPFTLQMPSDSDMGGSRIQDCPLIVDPTPMVRALIADRRAGVSRPVMARRFHMTLVSIIATLASKAPGSTVALVGGCFQNMLLLDTATRRLESSGFRVLTSELFPANDGGIALGQAVAAQHQIMESDGKGGGNNVPGHTR